MSPLPLPVGFLSQTDTYVAGRLTTIPTSHDSFKAEYIGFKIALKFVVLLIILNFNIIAVRAEDTNSAATLQFDFANSLYAREMFRLSIIEYNEFVARFPEDTRVGDALFYLGESYLKEKKVVEAVNTFDKYIKLFPDGNRAALIYYKKGVLKFSDLKYDISAGLFSLSLAAEPDNDLSFKVRYYLAKSYLEISEYDNVIKTLSGFSEKMSLQYPSLLFDLSAAYENTNQLSESVNLLRAYIKKSPDSEIVPSVQLRLSTNLIKLEKYEDAIRELQTIRDNPAAIEIKEKAYYQLCWCFYDIKEFETVLSTADEFVELFPESGFMTEALFLQAEAYYELGNYKDSIIFYKKVIDRNDSEKCKAESYYRAGIISAMEENYTDAINYFEAFIEGNSEHKMVNFAHLKSGEVFEKLKDYNQAVKHYLAYKDALPDGEYTEYSTFHLAMCYYYLEEYELMASAFEEFIERFPKSPRRGEALYYLGWNMQRIMDYESAIHFLEMALLDKTDLEISLIENIQYRLSVCYYMAKQYDKAAKGLYNIIENKIQKTIPENILLWLGQYMADNSEYEKAVAAYNTLLAENQGSKWTERCHYRLGEWYAKLDKWEESINQYQRLMQLFPETELLSFAKLGVADANRNLERFGDALPLYEELSQDTLTMVSARAKLGLGYVHLANARYEDAVRSFMYVAILFDDADLCSRALNEASDCWLLLDDEVNAVKVLEELIDRYPDGLFAEEARKKLSDLHPPE